MKNLMSRKGFFILCTFLTLFLSFNNYARADSPLIFLDPSDEKMALMGEEVAFSVKAIKQGAPSASLTYSASGLPEGAIFDRATQMFYWRPLTDYDKKTHELIFTATDGVNTARKTIYLSVLTLSEKTPLTMSELAFWDSVISVKGAPLMVTDILGGTSLAGLTEKTFVYQPAIDGYNVVTEKITDSSGNKAIFLDNLYTLQEFRLTYDSPQPTNPAIIGNEIVYGDDDASGVRQTYKVSFAISPIIDSVSVHGTDGEIIMLDITGRHFGDTKGDSRILYADIERTSSYWSDTRIFFQLPDIAAREDIEIKMVTDAGESNIKTIYIIPPTEQYTLTINAQNGTVVKTPDKARYNRGEWVALRAIPNSGYAFSSWSGDLTGNDFGQSIQMDSNKTITAHFISTTATYTLTINASNGAVAKNPNKTTYNSGERVTLTAAPNSRYEFSSWSGDLIDETNPATIIMDRDKTITANFTPYPYPPLEITYTLTIIAANGTVSKYPSRATYAYGDPVTLTATPNAGYSFSGWSGDLTDEANPATIIMNSNKTITANFTPYPPPDPPPPPGITYTLTIINASNGSVIKNPDKARYNRGEWVALTATPNAGYAFSGWSGDLTGVDFGQSIQMDSDKTITANFTPYPPAITYTLTINAQNGTVAKEPDRASYRGGEQVILTATPNSGYSFANWSGDLSGSASTVTITMDGNKTVTANFTQNTYTLTLTIGAGNGSVSKYPDKTSYSPGEVVTLMAVHDEGYSFANWAGDLTGSRNPAAIIMDGNKSVTANFSEIIIDTYTLRVELERPSYGSVTKSPDKAAYNPGDVVELTAIPNAGYSFVDWSGDYNGIDNPHTITMDGDKTIRARFILTTYTLRIDALHGYVTKDPDKRIYDPDDVVTLTAVPETGYAFLRWSGDLTGSSNPATITMDSNKSLTAVFTRPYILTISASNGSVSKNPDKAAYLPGEVVTLTAISNQGYSFSHWSDGLTGSANPTTITMNQNAFVTANFSPLLYTLTINAQNGKVIKAPDKGRYTYGEAVSLTAVASKDYVFSHWSGDLTGNKNPDRIKMDGNKSVTAHFIRGAYTLTINASGGTVTKNPNKPTYDPGERVMLTAVPNTGYLFSSWSGDLTRSANPAQITMDGSKSVTANFTPISYTLTINASNGTVTKNPNKATYPYGETVTLTATPNTGYSFASWSGDLTGATNPATITMNGNKTVMANFTPITYTLTIDIRDSQDQPINANFTLVSKNPNKATYNHGEVVTIMASSAAPGSVPGYLFVRWSGDLSGSAKTARITMDGNKRVTAYYVKTYSLVINGRVQGVPSSLGGSVSVNGRVVTTPSATTVTEGNVRLEAIPNQGYSFSGWSDDLTGRETPTTIRITGAVGTKRGTVNFTPYTTYTLGITAQNGTVTKNPNKPTYNPGDTVTLTATPNQHYLFSHWSGDLTGGVSSARITMNGNKSIRANFRRR